MDPLITTLVALLAILILLPACYLDYRYRQVPNVYWWALGILGMVFTCYSAFDAGALRWHHILCIAGAVLILLDMLAFDINGTREWWLVHVAMALCFVIPCFISFDRTSQCFLIIGLVFAVTYTLYRFGIILGGADVKCIVTMSMVFQVCPSLSGLPLIPVPSSMEMYFPFVLAVVFYAALISLLALFQIVLKKVIRKKDPVTMVTLTCYTMTIEEARRSHVWSKQDVEDGMIVNIRYTPDDGVYDRLEAVGATTVWVTPIIPFIIYLTVGAVIALVVGNVFFIPFN